MSLSSLIVQREVATIRQVEEALARQVIYGGDLVTNLFEVARVDEGIVTALLAETLGIPAANAGELTPPHERVRAFVPAEMAAHRAMVPLAIENDALIVAVADPLPKEVEEELAFALGMPISQRAAPMFRIREALSKVYGVPLERRVVRLIARLNGESVNSGSTPPLFAHPPQVVEPPRPRSEPPFRKSPAFGMAAAMPSRRNTSSGFPMPPPPLVPFDAASVAANTDANASADAGAGAGAGASADADADAGAGASASADAGASADATAGPAPERPPSLAPITERQSRPPTSRPPPSARAQLLQRDVTAPARPIRRRRGPLTMDVAVQEAEDATDRDALLDLFFEFSRQFFDYAALFLIHGDIAEGRDAFGVGASRERVVGIGVPLDLPSMLASAREKRRPITVRPAEDGLDGVLLADLSRTPRGPLVVVPVVVRTRAVALLLGDFGDGGSDMDSVGDVASFAQAIAQGFERIIVQKKLHGFVAGNRTSSIGRIDAVLVAPKKRATPAEPPPPPDPPRSDARSPMAISVATPTPLSVAQAAPSPPAQQPADEVVIDLSPKPKTSSSPPAPMPSVVAVRRPTGPPIPREEPESMREPRVGAFAAAPPATPEHESPKPPSAPSVEVATIDENLARELLEELAREPDASDDVIAAANESSAGPASQALQLPPHRPPSSRAMPAAQLPSVIIDIDHEFAALVERVIADARDEAAETELLRQGQYAMPAIMSRFPGPITIDRARLPGVPAQAGVSGARNERSEQTWEGTLRAGECGPILRLVAGQRKVALPFVVAKLDDADGERRFWATFLLAELHYPEAVPALMPRLFDAETRTRRAARLAAASIARRSPSAVVDELEKLAFKGSTKDRAVIVDALGELREPLAVPILIRVLTEVDGDANNHDLAATARLALTLITRQDLGDGAARWEEWWASHSGRHRIEWLIDALDHEVSDIRRDAGEELKSLTKEYFGFSEALPSRERQRAQQRYRDWWITEGRSRFRRR